MRLTLDSDALIEEIVSAYGEGKAYEEKRLREALQYLADLVAEETIESHEYGVEILLHCDESVRH